jgi:hypothetical protein
MGDHLAWGYGEAGGQSLQKWKAACVKAKRTAQRRCPGYSKGAGEGGETPSESESLGDDEEDEDEEEGEIIFPCSQLLGNLPSPSDIFDQ